MAKPPKIWPHVCLAKFFSIMYRYIFELEHVKPVFVRRKIMYPLICGSFKSAKMSEIGSTNWKSTKGHISGRSANLTHFVSSQICGFAQCSGSRIWILDEQTGSYFRELRNHFPHFLGLKYLNFLMQIRDPVWTSRIRSTGFAICRTYLWTAHLCSLNKYDNERELERGVGAGGPEGSTSVAYYENPGILMIVQTIEDGKGNHITSCDSLRSGWPLRMVKVIISPAATVYGRLDHWGWQQATNNNHRVEC